MKHSSRSLDAPVRKRSALSRSMRLAISLVLRNPVGVGGGTIFAVALFFVSANALWYQPHAHTAALIATRDISFVPANIPLDIEQPEPARPDKVKYRRDQEKDNTPWQKDGAGGDPVVKKVQSVLGDLELYTGSVDGIPGPQTRNAIEKYQRLIGLEVSGSISDELLSQLGTGPEPGSFEPVLPVSRPADEQSVQTVLANSAPQPESRPSGLNPDPQIIRIQAGLKAFGNDHIEIDGIVGEQTRSAIREFQTLFGMQVSGQADDTVVAKMQEIGLIQ